MTPRLLQRAGLLVLAVALLVLPGAAGAATSDATPGNAMVRVAHFSPDAPAVDVYVNGNKTLSGVPYKTVSKYLSVPSGTYRFEVRPAGADPSSKAVIDASSPLQAGQARPSPRSAHWRTSRARCTSTTCPRRRAARRRSA